MLFDGPHFGAWLRRKREAAGMTRHQLSVRAGVSAAQIYNLETGRTRTTREETCRRLIVAMRWDIESLCAFCGEPEELAGYVIASPRRDDVFICDGCLGICVAYVAVQNRDKRSLGNSPRARTRPIRKGCRPAPVPYRHPSTRTRGSNTPRPLR